ncbi:RagB/SusD family nutrient uptake outer membrane protein [Chitinophaga rhizophila]|uniref:RagB/SusD family nutrient uptake outer membrane protein n=1 Tax=Chitinophaga rhizophila TaxID=2866212 RepID=A0ABS7GEI6_9BACT|nr:RagB/SusD family nutrient uptake outer membrane protein [Chitinophaga rhizophila]MBW8685821.1 RagB/SusD family nutrient uptake outer membrane protein [Chitinophaga rhizophila]
MNRKNKIWIWLLAGVTCTGLFSCSKDLQQDPEQAIPTDDVFTSGPTSLSALYGVYSRSQRPEVFGGQPQIIGDYMADNADCYGTVYFGEISTFTATAASPIISEMWRIHFDAIMGANMVIEKVPAVQDPTFTATERKMYVAEAKFMRSILYFQLLNLFSQPYQVQQGGMPGIPIVTTAFDGTINYPSRGTVNEAHAQIEKDLLESIPDLATTFPDPVLARGRATKGAAYALLSRLYLYREQWDKAAQYADSVLNGAPYKLAADYSFYDGNTMEDVFSIQNTENDGPGGSQGWAFYYRPLAAGQSGGYCPFSASLETAFAQEANDKRFAMSDEGTAGNNQKRRFTLKFPNVITFKDNAPLIRVTEMYLNRAEALTALNGVNQDALELMNALRRRAGLSEWTLTTFQTKDAFLTAILNERRKELCFEGHRRMDQLRKGLSLRENDPERIAGAERVILPIPQRELDVSPALKGHQNPGY